MVSSYPIPGDALSSTIIAFLAIVFGITLFITTEKKACPAYMLLALSLSNLIILISATIQYTSLANTTNAYIVAFLENFYGFFAVFWAAAIVIFVKRGLAEIKWTLVVKRSVSITFGICIVTSLMLSLGIVLVFSNGQPYYDRIGYYHVELWPYSTFGKTAYMILNLIVGGVLPLITTMFYYNSISSTLKLDENYLLFTYPANPRNLFVLLYIPPTFAIISILSFIGYMYSGSYVPVIVGNVYIGALAFTNLLYLLIYWYARTNTPLKQGLMNDESIEVHLKDQFKSQLKNVLYGV